MGTPSGRIISLLLAFSLAGCGRVQVGVESAPAPALEATVAVMATDNARLAGQVATLSAQAAVAATPATATLAALATVAPAVPAATVPAPATEVSTVAPAASPTMAPPPTRPPTATATTVPASLAPSPSPTASGPQATVKAPVANLRSGPGTAYPVVGQASQGDALPILRRSPGSDWVQVVWQGRVAWLALSVADTSVAVAGLPVATPEAPPPTIPPSPAPSPQAEQPNCDVVPIRGFGKIWSEHSNVAATLGCPAMYPTSGEVGTDAAVQTFEHGLMLWLATDSERSSDPVYALFDNGEYQRFPDLGAADPSVVGSVDAGYFAPGSHFSKVYWEGTGARVRQRLGRATGEQTQDAGAYQQFNNGRMFWNKTLARIFVLYDYWRYPPGQPSLRVRSWASFADVFGQP